ncbi:MAG TPA: SEC-C metal-binding domain-containing protein [Opitutaceae bacterium]|nr:SEC-C metal-binding domain-containing protein [Opitutaceae bacterium]
MKLDTEAWKPVVGSPADPFLAIIRAMLEPEVEIHQQILSRLSAENGTPAQILATCVIELHRFWLSRQPKKPAAPAGSAMPLPLKLGRNDPCPCGSGRKYKNCCGSSLPHEPTPPAAPETPKA